jgi:peptide/nickel transport system substrate-binding protein
MTATPPTAAIHSTEGNEMNRTPGTGVIASRRRSQRFRRSRKSRWSAAVAIAAMLGLALAACSSNSPASSTAPSGNSGAPVEGGTLNVSFWQDNASLLCVDPFQVYWIEHRSEIQNFTDSLTYQDPATGKVIPHLASSWTISPNGETYTFKLRTDVTFSNGTAFNAAAVVANVSGWLATKKEVPGAYGDSYIANLAGAKAINASTVEIDLSAPNSSFLQATATTNLAILAPSAYQATPAQRCLGQGLIATGPFTLLSYTPNVGLILKKRAGYHWAPATDANQGPAYLDEIDFHYITDDSVRTGDLLNGTTDIDWPRNPFTPQELAQIKQNGDVIETRALPGVSYPYFANTTPGRTLSDPQVRQAIYEATDLQTIATTTHGSGYPVPAGVFDNTTPYFKSEASKLGYNLAGAEKILQADGWIAGSGGIRVKNGQKLVVVAPQENFDAPGVELWQSELLAAGIDLETPIIQASQLFAVLDNPSKWDLFGSYLTRADPGALRGIILPSNATLPGLAKAITAGDPGAAAQIQSLFTTATNTTSTAVAATAYGQLQDLLISQGLAFPLLERVQYAGVSPKVHGFQFTDEAFLDAHSIWISQ